MNAGRHPDDTDTRADPETIGTLVADLGGDDGSVRESARLSLVRLGSPAVAGLIAALGDAHRRVRWEAAKALEQIADPEAAPALVGALEDQDPAVRWLAAEGLIALKSKGLVPLLRALIERSDSFELREGAHHVLHDLHDVSERRLGGGLLKPLLAACRTVSAAGGTSNAGSMSSSGLRPPEPAILAVDRDGSVGFHW
jgi:HEAT repeat protein